MGIVDHLKGVDTNALTLEVAFGRHVVEGDLTKSNVTGTSPNHVVRVQHMLGDAFGKGWKAIEGAWFRGVNRPASKYRFHPGIYVPDPVLKNFTVNDTTFVFTVTSHGFANGDMVILKPGVLPTGLQPNVIYWVINVTTNTFQISLTQGGGVYGFSGTGSGTLQLFKNDPLQGIDPDFILDTNHSNTAWISLECPNGSEVGIPDVDTKNNPPTGFSGIFQCQTGDTYDNAGSVAAVSQLLVNPADVLGFGCKVIRGYDNARIDWPSLATLRSGSDATVMPDYTTLPEGVGLTGSYYDGSSFGTLKSKRVDPVIQYVQSTGAPALDITPTGFSVRFEGKIRFRFSGTYTMYLTHNDGGKLWIDNLTTPIINEWGTTGTHSATFTAVADQFYDIKMEWNNASGDSEFKLEWQMGTTQARQVVPQDRLYPKAEALKRFECHTAFPKLTTFDEFLSAVLFECNGDWQDSDGKLKFFCIDDLTPSFAFSEANIRKNTFKFYPRYSQSDLLQLPNRYLLDARDLDSRYLEKFDPPLYYDLPDLQAIAGRIIEETITAGNSRRWQGLLNLQHYAKRKTSMMVAEFEGLGSTYAVQKGDLVTLSHSMPGWVSKQFLVIESTDKQLPKGGSSSDGADDRIFKLLEWDTESGGDR